MLKISIIDEILKELITTGKTQGNMKNSLVTRNLIKDLLSFTAQWHPLKTLMG